MTIAEIYGMYLTVLAIWIGLPFLLVSVISAVVLCVIKFAVHIMYQSTSRKI